MITIWELSENNWEYGGLVTVESNKMPVVKMLSDGSCEMQVDGIIISFDEEIRLKEGDE